MREFEKNVINYIRFHENVAVAQICSEFAVSESTARRVLNKLETAGIVKRYHGGAHIVKSIVISDEFAQRRLQKNIIKRNIGKKASELVHNGDVIIMLGGTTVFAMCEFIMKKELTVITNSIPIFNKLVSAEAIELIMLGGVYVKKEMETRGMLAADSSVRLRANSLFMGATSITPTQGVATDDMTAVAQYVACAEISDKVYVMADSTKFKPSGYISVMDCTRIDGIITNHDDQRLHREFEKFGITMYRS